MTCTSLDLTIDDALADPLIAAAMRADRVDPGRLETLLRATARDLRATRSTARLPLAVLADRMCGALTGSRPRW